MRVNRKYLPGIACGIMGFSWIYGLSTFTLNAVFHEPYPLISALCIYALGTWVTAISTGKGWRIISVLLLHLIALSISLLRMIHLTLPDPASFFDRTWFFTFIAVQRPPMQWLYLVLLLFWGIMLWLGGMRLVRIPLEYRNISNRFDLGIAAFLSVMLIKLLFFVKTGNNLNDPSTLHLILPFFVFGLLALGLTGSENDPGKEYLPGFRTFGIISTFSALILLTAAALVALYLPYLRHAADFSYWAMKEGGRPFVPYIIAVLRFLFGPGQIRSAPRAGPLESGETSAVSGMEEITWLGETVRFILEKSAVFLFLAAMVFVTGLLFYLLGKWLLSATSSVPDKRHSLTGLFRMFTAEFILMCHRIKVIYKRIRGEKDPIFLFNRLQHWGRHNGQKRLINETPTEYGSRLSTSFPELETDIHLIISTFNDNIYGEIALDEKDLSKAGSAWKKLRSPRLWPVRMKVMLHRMTC